MSTRNEGESPLACLGRAFAFAAVTTLISACGGGSGGGSSTSTSSSPSPSPSPAPAPAPAPAAFSGKFVDAWSSANSSVAWTLSTVDERDGRKAATLDTIPVTAGTGVIRVRGGSYDGVSGNISQVLTSYVVYSKSGAIYKLPMQTTGAVPAPARVSTEANLVALPAGAVVAQSLSGDEALLRYDTNILGQTRYVFLSMTPTSIPITLPPSSFIGAGTQQVVAGINDPGSGALTGFLMIDGQRFYRTDASFANPVPLHTYSAGGPFQAPGAPSVAKMKNGFFFVTDGVLRRYDFVKAAVQVVGALNSGGVAVSALADDSVFYVLYEGVAGYSIMKANDSLDSPGTILAANLGAAGAGSPAPRFSQTKDYLIFQNTSGQAVSIRKSDGAQVNLGGVAGDWNTISTSAIDGPSGNRVFYTRADAVSGKRIVGSLNADGTDRKEIVGASFAGVRGLVDLMPVHRSQIGDARGPFGRLLVAIGDITNASDLKGDIAWLNATTGNVDFVAGSLGSATLGVEPVGPFNAGWIGAAGTFTAADKTLSGLGLLRTSYYIRQAPNSLLAIP